MEKLGFIGCGKMASAIISGCLASGEFEKENFFASEINETAVQIAKGGKDDETTIIVESTFKKISDYVK